MSPSGTVDGIDLSPAMVEHTAALLRADGLAGRVQVMDAVDPPLPPASFDVVASSLVLFFMPDPPAALARWVALLAPGGRIGLTTFGDEHPVWTQLDDLFRPWVPPGMLDPKVVGPDAPFASDAGMETMLRDAGATDVRTVTLRIDVPWGDVDGWKAFSMSTGQRAMWAAVPAEERETLLVRAGEILEDAPRRLRPRGHLAGHALHPRQCSWWRAVGRRGQPGLSSATERTRARGVPSIHSTASAPPRPPMASVGLTPMRSASTPPSTAPTGRMP